MSGITGLYHLDSRPPNGRVLDPPSLERMSQAIAHRGPDGIRQWISGPIGLGNLKLQTTPESVQEKQPLSNADASLCLTLDGRIDNRRELRQALDAKGFKPREDSDAELVLRAYE
jgi:asparagine synthase (glutamine-hydrolysing)